MPKHLTHSHLCRAFPRWQRWTKEERAGAPAAACSLRMCKSAANSRVSRTSNIVHCPHGHTCKICPTRTRALRRSMFLTRGSKLDHRRSQHLMRLRAMIFPQSKLQWVGLSRMKLQLKMESKEPVVGFAEFERKSHHAVDDGHSSSPRVTCNIQAAGCEATTSACGARACTYAPWRNRACC